jgi:membrane-bound serine protease (ClpP class)
MMIVLATQEAGDTTYFLWGFILLAVAIALVSLELFVPSGGLIAALAGVAIIGSITSFFMYDFTSGILALTLYIIFSPIVLWAMFKFWIHSPLAGKMILGGSEPSQNNDESDPMAAAEQARRERLAQLRELIGAEGMTVTSLRPVGTVRIEGQRIDAMAESGTIEANTPVVVTDVYDNQIKVRPK